MEIKIQNLPHIVTDQDWFNFDVPADGLYLVTITARCKSWLQNFLRRFNDDDLAVQIDDYFFGELSGKKREFNIIGTWNGNELKNALKAVVFVLPLKLGGHQIKFWTDKLPLVEEIQVSALPFGEKMVVIPVPVSVAAVDLVLKNVVDEKITVTNLIGGEKSLKTSAWSNGVRVARLNKSGQPSLKSFVLTMNNDSIRYKIALVKLYSDITTLAVVNLYTEPNASSVSLAELVDGTELEILTEKVIGDWIAGKSNIWHKVRYQDQEGFVLSSFVEIQGQERDKIINLIKAKCLEPKVAVDANIMLAIAGIESHYKPYAVAHDENGKEAQGVFQLRQAAAVTVHINDRLDLYENIDGGARYYKLIQDNKKIQGRGYILEQRLLAWHNGPTAVESGRDNYKTIASSSDGAKFVRNVLANIKQRDWTKIIKVAMILLVTGLNYGLGRYWFPEEVRYVPLDITFSNQWVEVAYAAGNLDLQPDPDTNSIELKSNYGIKKIIVSGLIDKNNRSFTELAYWGNQDEKKIILDGKFRDAGWNNGFFTVTRYRENGEEPMALFDETNGVLIPVKIIYKDGRTETELYNPEFLYYLISFPVGEVKNTVYNYESNQIEEIVTEFTYDKNSNELREADEMKRARDLPEQAVGQSHLSAVLDKTIDEILFSTPFKTLYHFPISKLIKNDDFDVAGAKGGALYIHSIVKNVTGEIFYFLANTSVDCGAQNCHSVLYRLDLVGQKVEKIKEDVFGEGVSLELSPNGEHLAIATSVHGGFCSNGAYYSIMDTESFKLASIKGYNWPGASGNYGQSSSWKNNDEFQFALTQSKCSGPKWGDRDSEYNYNLKQNKLILLKEEYKPEGRG